MTSQLRLSPFAAAAALAVIAFTALAWSPGGQEVYTPESVTAKCNAVATDFAVLQRDMSDLDQALYASIETMRAAPEDEQIEAIQMVIEEMAQQRTAMREHMKMAHQQLVVHLVEHIEVADEAEAAGPLSCPLMKHLTPDGKGRTSSDITESLDH